MSTLLFCYDTRSTLNSACVPIDSPVNRDPPVSSDNVRKKPCGNPLPLFLPPLLWHDAPFFLLDYATGLWC
ncbi:hypothetical protein JTE90_028091 [Oedothorax gibbosus]|uniref:Uncharacterized protein n=1 Tax=Oedothorax gibbosus TaxID=931172 RepID=A0AAV6VAH1_9ARAC|nr:hypothetical protein JTE90_028091 [Oedothorax gibbosus]